MSETTQAVRERGGWLPIESAPKDGTFVLCCHASGHINIMQYGGDEDAKHWRRWVHNDYHNWQPTHWQPLPDPPEGL